MAFEVGRGEALFLAWQWRQVEFWDRLVDQGRGQHLLVDAEPDIEARRHQHEHGKRDYEEPVAGFHSAACTLASGTGRLRRAGAPTRCRRSLSDTRPPNAINAAPSQIHGTSGFQ